MSTYEFNWDNIKILDKILNKEEILNKKLIFEMIYMI